MIYRVLVLFTVSRGAPLPHLKSVDENHIFSLVRVTNALSETPPWVNLSWCSVARYGFHTGD